MVPFLFRAQCSISPEGFSRETCPFCNQSLGPRISLWEYRPQMYFYLRGQVYGLCIVAEFEVPICYHRHFCFFHSCLWIMCRRNQLRNFFQKFIKTSHSATTHKQYELTIHLVVHVTNKPRPWDRVTRCERLGCHKSMKICPSPSHLAPGRHKGDCYCASCLWVAQEESTFGDYSWAACPSLSQLPLGRHNKVILHTSAAVLQVWRLISDSYIMKSTHYKPLVKVKKKPKRGLYHLIFDFETFFKGF